MGKDFKDLDKLIEDERFVKLAGQELDVTKLPSKYTLEMAKKVGQYDDPNDPAVVDETIDTIAKILDTQNDKEITPDWLLENTTMDQLLGLIEFIMEPINERQEEAPEGVKKKAQEQ